MIIYWETLEENAGNVSTLPVYMSSDYFGGIVRIKSGTAFPTGSVYGAICYRSDLKKYLGFKEDSGWGELGGAAGIDFLLTQVFN